MSLKRDTIEAIFKADTLLESFDIFKKNQELLEDCKFMFAEKGKSNIPEHAQKRYFSDGSAIFNIFCDERIIFLDKKVVQAIMRSVDASINLDYSVSIDTQGISYLEPYLTNEKCDRLPKDFDEVFNYLVKNNVNIDPMPYIIENIPNIKEKDKIQRIREKLNAYEILKNIDLEKYKKNNIIVSKKSKEEIDKEIFFDIEFMIEMNKNKNKEIDKHYRLRYCLLLKMILIKLRSKKSQYKKLGEFIEFCHSELYTLSLREIIIANKYYQEGQNLTFFGKIQKNRKNLIDEIKNMAWDLYHVSEMERNFERFSQENYYYFPSFLTFDKRLIEIIELYSLKAICISGNNDIYPAYDMSNFIELIKENSDLEKYITDEAKEIRDSKRETVNISNIINDLENELLLIING